MTIEKHLLKGVETAYKRSQYFCFDWNLLLENLREYHITIETANSLKNMVEEQGIGNLKIVLEAKTKLVENSCIESNKIIWKDVFSSYIPEKFIEGKVSRKGFVDIAIFEEQSDLNLYTKHVIEIKSINTSWDGIRKDFKRLVEYLLKKDNKGNYANTIESCFLLFIRQTNAITSSQNNDAIEKWKKDNMSLIERKLKNWKRELNAEVNYKLYRTGISCCTQEELTDKLELDYHDVLEKTGVSMAYCVKITREKNGKK
ncbi:MAG: hypothetical protein JJT77_11865 [Crocinitomicaceae bacterium]|nr:hypothetical protein [Crocinitomicaceae bacterium]